MKKLFLVFFIVASILSCDKDEENPTGSGSDILITRFVTNYANNTDYSKSFNYEDGNKLSSTVDANETREYYTYDGDFVTNIDMQFKDPKFSNERFFTYDDSGRLIEEIKLYEFNSVGERTVFTYETNGVVNYETFLGNLVTQNTPNVVGAYKLSAAGQILEHTFTDTQAIDRVLTYTYDDKYASHLNIRDGSKGFKYIFGGLNNVKTHKFEQSGMEIYSYTSDFEYNSNNYPVSEHKNESGTDQLVWTLFTYNK